MQRLTHENFSKSIKAINPCIRLLSRYKSARAKIKVECLVCNAVWYAGANRLRYNGCPSCWHERRPNTRRYTGDQYVAQVFARHGSKIKVIDPENYVNQRTKLWHKCIECSYKWQACSVGVVQVGTGCPACASNLATVTKQFCLGKRRVLVDGYEHYGLQWILNNTDISPSDILVSKVDKIPLLYFEDLRSDGNAKWHKPDFWIPSKKLYVEVKSLTTAGLGNDTIFGKPCKLFELLKAKRNLAIKQGLRYNLLVFDAKGDRVKLPTNWFSCSHSSVINFLEGHSK